MTRKEFRAWVKERFKEMGFKAYRSFLYREVSDDCLLGFYLEPSSYYREYECTFGVLYLPDETQNVLEDRRFDITMCFEFPWEADDPWAANFKKSGLPNMYIAYERYTEDEVVAMFEKNIHDYLMPFFDRTYGLRMLRQNPHLYRGMPEDRVQFLRRLVEEMEGARG